MKEELIKLIFTSLQKLRKRKEYRGIKIAGFTLEHPRLEKFGDWSTNAAMVIAKQTKKEPMQLGKDLVALMNKKIVQYKLVKIELVKPGFINFYLQQDYLYQELKSILKADQDYGKSNQGKGKKVMLEFISANPTGPLTLGNARGGFLGDNLARILEWNGWKVSREYYINDTGKQVQALGHSVLKDEEASYRGDYIEALHKRNKLKDPVRVGEWASKVIIEEMVKKTVARMNIHFDTWFSEKSLVNQSKVEKVVRELKKRGYTKEKDNAVWFLLSKFKSAKSKERGDCVLQKSNGEFTYLAGDIAYHKNKFKKRKFDQVINIWGADHHGDVPRLQAGLEALGINVPERLRIILVQFVRLVEKGKEVRMSKRRGTYITIDELLDQVPLDVARFFFLMYDPNSHMDFDLNLARDTSPQNPVYYVQYAHARICSILKKASEVSSQDADLSLLKHAREIDLVRSLIRFPEVVKRAGSDLYHYEAHQLPYYAISLAERFHKFYKECRVIGEDQKLSQARLALVSASRTVLKNALYLMGISAPEKM